MRVFFLSGIRFFVQKNGMAYPNKINNNEATSGGCGYCCLLLRLHDRRCVLLGIIIIIINVVVKDGDSLSSPLLQDANKATKA
jgi:hypothetical protein